VYQALRYAFMSGAIKPGSSLTSRSLSEALGVSPTPVREALKRLDGDGAVVSRNKSAFFVYDPDKVDFAELFEVRLILEGRAIHNAALKARESDLKRIRKVNDEYQNILAGRGAPGSDPLQSNFRFHFEIYKLSGSSVLVEMIEVLWLRIGPALQRYKPSLGDTRISTYHAGMLDALAANDPVAAEEALRNDLTGGFQAIEPQLRERRQV
jgi:DNA-binding GntR family transcriptional regulator